MKRASNFKTSSWWYCPRWNIILGCAPKCGSTSLFKVLRDNNISVWNPEGHNWNAYAVWIVREPVSRFTSLWKDKCRDGDPLWDDGQDYVLLDMNPEQLMDFIETGPMKDSHWATQTSLCGRSVNEIVPLDKFTAWWNDRGFPEMSTQNESEGDILLSTELITRILDHYSKDVALYNAATENEA